MSNYKFKLNIRAKDIYDNLLPEQKEQIKNVEIIKATLVNNDSVWLECLAVDDEVVELPYAQIVSPGSHIIAKDI